MKCQCGKIAGPAGLCSDCFLGIDASSGSILRPKKERKGHRDVAFEQGYICAVATLLRTHGSWQEAKDVLNCIKLPDKSDIAPEDYAILKEHGLVK